MEAVGGNILLQVIETDERLNTCFNVIFKYFSTSIANVRRGKDQLFLFFINLLDQEISPQLDICDIY